jgi:hypothetical protein
MNRLLAAALAATGALAATPADARPIAYAGATTLMLEAGADGREAMLFHAPTHWYSFGAGWHRVEGEDDEVREYTYLRGNLLAKRWNLRAAQANAFVWGSAGRSRGAFDGSAWNAGFQLDYETLDIYTMLKSEWWTGAAPTHRMDTLQLGFAPYRHRYGGWATWLVGMVENKAGGLEGTPEYSLLARFFNETTWIEAGVDDDGDPRMNLMINF